MRLAAAAMLMAIAGSPSPAAAEAADGGGAEPVLLIDIRGSLRIEAVPLDEVEATREGLAWPSGEGGGLRRLRWDRVRDLRVAAAAGRTAAIGDACPEFAAGVSEDRSRGERLWRGIARLERGDAAAARAVLEPLAEELADESSLRARLVAAWQLRARLAGDADPVAVADAAIRCVRLEAMDPGPADEAWSDASHGSPDPALDRPLRFEEGWPAEAPPLPAWGRSGEEVLAALDPRAVASRPLLAASLASLVGDAIPPTIAGETQLPQLWRTLLEIRRSDPATLAERRESWLRGVDPADAAVIHAHLGARLRAEASPDLRRRGLLEWLAIPAAAPDPDSPTVRWAWRRIAEAAAEEGLGTLADHAVGRIGLPGPASTDAERSTP